MGGDLRGGSRSPSPSPLGNSHSMTSIGPGLSPSGGRTKLGKDLSDDPLGSSNRARSPAALGPLGGSRAPSPAPPPHQSMTSIGPGFDGRGRSPSPAPPPLNRPGSAHSGGQRQLTADSIGSVQKSDKKHKKDKNAEDDGGSSDHAKPPPSPSLSKKDKKDKKEKKDKKDSFVDEDELGSGSYNFDVPM